MSKVKKVFAVFLLVMTTVLLMPITTWAAEKQEEKVIVYTQIPKEWEDPCIWAWDEDGNNAFDAWPGGEMDADEENEGWYYCFIPGWATHVIINANDGTVQTGELILEGKNTWISISDADTVDISYDKQTEGELPEYVEKFIIHASVDESWKTPCLWAWSAPDGTNVSETWPGMEMKEEENGWYTAKAPVWVNSIIINANEGAIQTEDISIDPAEVWVTVEADGTSSFSYKDPEKEAMPNVVVHVMAPSDWENACLWAWSAPDGTNVYTTWPGEALEEGNGWLTKEIPGWVNSIIINANDGSVQTTDISVETGKDVWVVVNGSEEFEVSYEEPSVETADKATEENEVIEPSTEMPEESAESAGSNTVWIIIAALAIAVFIVVIVVVKKKTEKK